MAEASKLRRVTVVSESGTPPKTTFGVEMGPGEPRIRIQIGERSIPVDIRPDQAAELGLALLAASAVCSPGHPRPAEGEPIHSAHMPVLGWQTGTLSAARLPVLVTALLGGARLILRFTPEQAASCGEALNAVAATVQDPPAG
jgi:hypothetical protein